VPLRWSPGDSDARRECVAIGFNEAARQSERARVRGRNNLGGRESWSQEQIRQSPVLFGVRREVFVSEPDVDRKAARDSVVVLNIGARGPAVEIRVGATESQRAGLRIAQEKIREIETCSRHGLALGVQLAGKESAEAERSARILIVVAVLIE